MPAACGAQPACPAVVVEGLRKRYGSFAALDAVTMIVNRGEIFGLLGRNGAGKSTALDIVCGLLRPTSGRVEVFGKDVTRCARQIRGQIGYVPQENTVYLALTVRQNLHFSAIVRGMSRQAARRRAAEVMERLGLDQIAGRGAAKLSGGERRRLSIGMGIVHAPPLMVLDEPSTGVDIDSRQAIHGLLREFRGEGKTVFYTTHHLGEAETLCDRVAVLDAGAIIAAASVTGFVQEFGKPYLEVVSDEVEPATAVLKAVIPGSAITVAGNKVRVWVDAKEDLAAIIQELSQKNVPVKDVRAVPVSLENAFLCATEKWEAGQSFRKSGSR